MPSPGYAVGLCKVRCSFCGVKLAWQRCIGCYSRAGQVVVCGGCGFAECSQKALPTVCEWSALGIPLAVQSQMPPVQCAAGVVEPVLGATTGLGVAVLLNAGVFQF